MFFTLCQSFHLYWHNKILKYLRKAFIASSVVAMTNDYSDYFTLFKFYYRTINLKVYEFKQENSFFIFIENISLVNHCLKVSLITFEHKVIQYQSAHYSEH